MASPGFGLAEAYVTRKLFKETMKKRAEEEINTNMMRNSTIKRGSEDKTSSGCFSWVSMHQHTKVSPFSDCNHSQVANIHDP
ncbi:hypothetical protein VNO78_30983 [Psophocarpus tetragonolobus]|uniref:Uncharacterized protein n=1 Tax=Psophocarpus tetragonolobus TaxID=3891 RepID=A0AAN9RZ21_PSOTE